MNGDAGPRHPPDIHSYSVTGHLAHRLSRTLRHDSVYVIRLLTRVDSCAQLFICSLLLAHHALNLGFRSLTLRHPSVQPFIRSFLLAHHVLSFTSRSLRLSHRPLNSPFAHTRRVLSLSSP